MANSRLKTRAWQRDPNRYEVCQWEFCREESTDRYPLPFCQEHVLYIWSLVNQDIQASSKTPDDVQRERQAAMDRREAERREQVKQVKQEQEGGFIYFVKVDRHIKIGFTKDPYRRGGAYPPSAELLASYPGTRRDEQRLHEKFAAYLDAGREWFLDAREIRDHIDKILAGADGFKASMARRRGDSPARLRSRTARAARQVIR